MLVAPDSERVVTLVEFVPEFRTRQSLVTELRTTHKDWTSIGLDLTMNFRSPAPVICRRRLLLLILHGLEIHDLHR